MTVRTLPHFKLVPSLFYSWSLFDEAMLWRSIGHSCVKFSRRVFRIELGLGSRGACSPTVNFGGIS